MKIRMTAYLELMRFPNTFTAMADILAGYFIVRGLNICWTELVSLLLSTTCIYGAGCVLNDLHDRKQDALERPLRPIPSGRVSLRESWALTVVLFTLGLMCAFLAGLGPFFVAVILVMLVGVYDLLTKSMIVLGPLTMALCRASNLILGMSPNMALTTAMVVFPIITLCYVFYLTTLSRYEAGQEMNRSIRFIYAGGFFVIIYTLYIIVRLQLLDDSLLFLGMLAVVTGLPLFASFLKSGAEAVGRAVKFFILGIPLLDAVYVSGVHGWGYGIPVALCIVPAIVLSRYYYVT